MSVVGRPRTDDDGTGRCSVCGGIADHLHTEDREQPGDSVLVVELAPEMLEAMAAASERDVALDLPDLDAEQDADG